jgi:hypothetical protein
MALAGHTAAKLAVIGIQLIGPVVVVHLFWF